MNLDGCIIDERLSSAECLAMTHRPEVMRTFTTRFASSQHLTDCLQYDLWHYDTFVKPLVSQEQDCLAGATMVDVATSFNINVCLGVTLQALMPVVMTCH